MKIKSPEEILEKYLWDDPEGGRNVCEQDALWAMKAYADQLELSDDEIGGAEGNQTVTPFTERWIGFIKGAKWYREQIRQMRK